jgi:hypothetical protein
MAVRGLAPKVLCMLATLAQKYMVVTKQCTCFDKGLHQLGRLQLVRLLYLGRRLLVEKSGHIYALSGFTSPSYISLTLTPNISSSSSELKRLELPFFTFIPILGITLLLVSRRSLKHCLSRPAANFASLDVFQLLPTDNITATETVLTSLPAICPCFTSHVILAKGIHPCLLPSLYSSCTSASNTHYFS